MDYPDSVGYQSVGALVNFSKSWYKHEPIARIYSNMYEQASVHI